MVKNEILYKKTKLTWKMVLKAIFIGSVGLLISFTILPFTITSISNCNENSRDIKWEIKSLVMKIGEEYVKHGKPVKFDNLKHLPDKLYKCNRTSKSSECKDTNGGVFFKTKKHCFLGLFDCTGGVYSVSIDNRDKDDSYIILNTTHQGLRCQTVIFLNKNEKYGYEYKYSTECEMNSRCKGPTIRLGT